MCLVAAALLYLLTVSHGFAGPEMVILDVAFITNPTLRMLETVICAAP